MKEQAVQSEPYILVQHTVTDLDDFVAHPENYLVSMFQEPGRAASIWRDRLKRNPYGSEGFLSLSYHGIELIPGELWDEVTGIWFELIELVEEYLHKGSAERLFPGQPVPLRLEVEERSTLFTVSQQKNRVDPSDFIPGILEEAHRYFTWVEENIGTGEGQALQAIDSLHTAFLNRRIPTRHSRSRPLEPSFRE
ncbi:hypothetical protein [Glutamicibacter protophormiae]|uniref:hypothetical protein n=1 Tax=Glutamicibacter protophormiae TaxID=37930 RepID=UPI00195A961A|nr:hypothetical protein [Glutamicibacter protophormiae]QRQ78450.1 hypothetical protein JQN66_16365 [Glutamicibacter protophormiae]